VPKDCRQAESDNCTTYSCVDGQCKTDITVCNDNDPCTDNACIPSYGCNYTQRDCGETNACVTRGCSGGFCTEVFTPCVDGNFCTDDGCDPVTGCTFTPKNCSLLDTPCKIYSCDSNDGSCRFVEPDCNDNNPCTRDVCTPGVGCENIDIQCEQSSKCFAVECVGDDGSGGPLCNITTPRNCDDNNSCTIDLCKESVDNGCVYIPYPCQPTFACDYPIGCIGDGPEPECVMQNITNLFDFCGIYYLLSNPLY